MASIARCHGTVNQVLLILADEGAGLAKTLEAIKQWLFCGSPTCISEQKLS